VALLSARESPFYNYPHLFGQQEIGQQEIKLKYFWLNDKRDWAITATSVDNIESTMSLTQ
jgi:hypothetical protein